MYRVDVEQKIKDEGINLIKKELPLEHKGYIEYDNDNNKFTIVINKSHGPRFQRFTMAHMLGHYMYHYYDVRQCGSLDKNF